MQPKFQDLLKLFVVNNGQQVRIGSWTHLTPITKKIEQVKSGDAICISGDVGAAIAGLRILMRENCNPKSNTNLLAKLGQFPGLKV